MTRPAAAAQVESLIARCLLDADFLRDANADPVNALAARNLTTEAAAELEALDLARVRQFAGFITKVQHNHLWELTPYTRALLKHYGIEIETFAAYHGRHLELRERGASRSEKDEAFFAFLDELAASRDDVPGLRDILRHERIVLELQRLRRGLQEGGPGTAGEPRSERFAACVPSVRGVLRIAAFDCDPLAIAATVSRGALDSDGVSARPVTLAYSAQSHAREPAILEVDDLTAALLGAVDGRRSVRAVVARVAGRSAPDELVARVRPILDAAIDAGVLTLSQDGSDAPCG
jgi:hypothetical protein